MSQHEINLKIPDEILAIAKINNIKLCIPETHHVAIPAHDIPDVYGVMIGKQDRNTDQLISNITDDENCTILQKYIKLGLATAKTFYQSTDNDELRNVPHYFVLYDVLESSKHRPTYTEDGPGDGYPMNGYYTCQYEILLGIENFTRRMLFETKSVNQNMGDWIKDLIDNVKTAFNNPDELDNTLKLKDYLHIKDDTITITMFDEVGIPSDIECESASTFLSFIRSIRQIDCTFVEQ